MVMVTVAMLLIRPWFQEKGGDAGTKKCDKVERGKNCCTTLAKLYLSFWETLLLSSF